MRRVHPLNSARRRVRKEQLARRHGQRCAYCRRPFVDLSEATLDHIAPQSLWRSWSVTSLMLACTECNQAKADRLPLSLALLLCSTGVKDASTPVEPPRETEDNATAPTCVTTRVTLTVTPRVEAGSTPVNPTLDAESTPINPTVVNTFLFTCTPGIWRLLARLAHAHHPVFTAVWSADSDGGQSTSELHESTRPACPARRPSARPDCLRGSRPVRLCSGPTGEAVPA
ncbi:HNH endonuclease [Streptomyces sp. NPDC059766]|uniref:HNH endonuclease n=1 Tax=Streptomyces sp. NPDC059766 TaxID=3346940 RepID=UPI00364B687F